MLGNHKIVSFISMLALCGAPGMAWGQGLFEQALSGDLSADDTDTDGDDQAEGGSASKAKAGGGDTTFDSGAFLESLARNFELNGYVRGDLFVGKALEKDATDLKAGYGEASLKLRARVRDWGDAFTELRFLAGAQQGEAATDLQLREAYMNLFLGPVDLRVGHQIIVWGRADGVNPTDNLTPRDMNVRSANVDDRRLANMAVRLQFHITPEDVEGRARIELVWVPFYAASQFPNFSLGGPLAFGEPDIPDFNLTKGIGALKLDLETPAFEGSFSALIGHATFPGLALQGVTMPPDPFGITVGFSAYRHVVIGADFSASISDWFGLRGEAAFRFPFDYTERPDIPLPDFQLVLGVDRELFGGFVVAAHYIGRYVVNWYEIEDTGFLASGEAPSPEQLQMMKQAGIDPLGLVEQEIQRRARIIHQQTVADSHSAAVRISWLTLQDTLTLELYAMVNFSTEEILVRPAVTYAISDAFSVVAGAEIYAGPDDTLFGMADEVLSAGFAELKLSF